MSKTLTAVYCWLITDVLTARNNHIIIIIIT